MVTPRERELGTKVHDLLHWIKSGGDSVNDRRSWLMQVFADATTRFQPGKDDAGKKQVEDAVRTMLQQYGMTRSG